MIIYGNVALMRIYLLPVALLLLTNPILTYGKLPDANSVLQQVTSKDDTTEAPDEVSESIERLKSLSDPTERAKEWITLLTAITTPSSSSNRYLERNKAQSRLKELGNYFPEKSEWPILKEQLQAAIATSADDKVLNQVRFIIALLESDEATALDIFNSQMPSHTTEGNSITKALDVIDPYGTHDRQGQQLLNIALGESSLPAMQKAAIETWLATSSSGRGHYYYHIPDLSLYYSGDELHQKLTQMCKAIGERLEPSRLSESLRDSAYKILKEENMTPSQNWIRFLDPQSSSYQADVDYLESKRTDENSQTAFTRLQLHELIKQNRVDDAWSLWQEMAEKNSQEAGRFILSLFGWQSRNYPHEAISEMAQRLLPLIENSKMLKELSAVFPQNSDSEDPILHRANQLIAASQDPLTILQLQFIKLDRYLAFNQLEEATQLSATILSSPEQITQLVKQQEGLQLDTIVNYAVAFRISKNESVAQLWIDLTVQNIDSAEDYQKSSALLYISNYYMEDNESDLAFKYAVQALKTQNTIAEKDTYRSGPIDLSNQLTHLVSLYSEAGQYADVLTLLDQANGWNAEDLENVYSYTAQGNIQTLAALALHHTGQSENASKILRTYLRYYDNSSDAAYAALIEVEGASAAPFLKVLQAEAPFEERPLIWQAVLEQQADNLDSAEALARAAIEIDPTDGEMDEFDRLRAYALLGEILAAQGSDEAELYLNIVKAVDTAEIGDRYRVAGLKSQALIHYNEAINLFKDAYCVRFRTAVELEAAGRIEEAEEHFEAAYTLMPDQFGRIESHCFGCEGAFSGERAGSIAERVFTRMLKERPNKPSLHYLMGYLKESQDEQAEALEHFKRAVELDPLYYNAWGHIRSLASSSASPDSELAMQATVAMLQFAPRRSASLVRNLQISEYGKIWDELDAQYPILPERESGMYPLKASAEEMKQQPESGYYRNWRTEQWDITTPAQLLFQQDDVSQLLMQD